MAGWAVVVVGSDGELLGILKGLLWAPWPRTPQAAEFAAFAWSGAIAGAPANCFSDCQNVVDHVALGSDALSGKRQYSGFAHQGRDNFDGNIFVLRKWLRIHILARKGFPRPSIFGGPDKLCRRSG